MYFYNNIKDLSVKIIYTRYIQKIMSLIAVLWNRQHCVNTATLSQDVYLYSIFSITFNSIEVT